jgi:hypothetical protein
MGERSFSKPSRVRGVMQALPAVASLSLNVFLAAHLLHSRPTLSVPTSQPAGPQPVTTTLGSPPIPDAAAVTLAPTHAPPFRWAEIESADYREYVANLRAVGCPEQIIRDIIVADVNQLFAARAQAIWKPRVAEYWQKSVNQQPSPQQTEQFLALDKEKRAMFQEVLGIRPSQQELIDTLYLQVHGSEEQLLFLPADKREAALQALNEADFEAKEAKLHAEGGYSQAAQEKLFAEKAKILAGVLSPEELQEFRLRNSQTAQSLRMEVQYFSCTPDEFKLLFTAREQKADGKNFGADLLNRTAATEEVRKLFGDERAKEFERVTDLFYLNIRRPAEEQGVALDLVDQAWQVTRAARTTADEVAHNTNLTSEERQRQVQATRQQAEIRLTELLGERASRAVVHDLRNVLGATEANIKP